MPMATMAPHTAGRFSAKPIVGPSSDMITYVRPAETPSEATAMNDRPR